MLSREIRLACVGVLASGAATVGAWNGTGHEQIADIAWNQLTSRSKQEIARILLAGDVVTRNNEPGVSFVPIAPSSGLSDSYLEREVRPAFRKAANWADAIKGGRSSRFESWIESMNAGSPGVTPPPGEHIGARGEEVRCKSWHYMDLAVGDPRTAHPPRESNALRALDMARQRFEEQELLESPDRATQVYWLYWIEHLVGDLHQPLHCVSDYSAHADGDAGGNFFKLDGNAQLHSFWDAGVDHAVTSDQGLTVGGFETITQRWMQSTAEHPTKAQAADTDVLGWVRQGRDLATQFVYKGLRTGEKPGDEYFRRHAGLCKRQALLAGARLAYILNECLDSH